MTRLSTRYSTALVTGASGGLGRAFAEMLLAEGLQVWGTARDIRRLDPLKAQHPARFHPVALDLAEAAQVEKAFSAAAAAAGGAFDVVVNNAGFGVYGRFLDEEFEVWRRQIDSMLTQTMALSRHAVRRMQERTSPGGALVNIASMATEFPLPHMTGYNVAKAGLSAFSESLMFETRGTPVTVIDFRPGDYRTSFNQAMSTPSTAADPRLAAVWARLEANLKAAPGPERAAQDLRRALLAGRSGVVRSGSFFQTRLAPFLVRFAPASWVRAASARYFSAV